MGFHHRRVFRSQCDLCNRRYHFSGAREILASLTCDAIATKNPIRAETVSGTFQGLPQEYQAITGTLANTLSAKYASRRHRHRSLALAFIGMLMSPRPRTTLLPLLEVVEEV